MKIAFRYSGGKTRELKRIAPVIPTTGRIVEPFAGGAAVAFNEEREGTILSDLRLNVINCYQQLADPKAFKKIMKQMDEWKALEDMKELETIYYQQRDDLYGNKDPIVMALRWLFIRQTTFSGIDRINGSGKINSPFGWKKFTSNITEAHHEFLKSCDIKLRGFDETLLDVNSEDWVFLDPPYLNRNSTYGGDYEDDLEFHTNIRDAVIATGAKFLMVHIDCPEYRELYKDFNIMDKEFNYAQNFMGRDNSNQKVKHLYITNYK